jgi:hypothetical protein
MQEENPQDAQPNRPFFRDRWGALGSIMQPSIIEVKRASIEQTKEEKENGDQKEYIRQFQFLNKDLRLGKIKESDMWYWKNILDLLIMANHCDFDQSSYMFASIDLYGSLLLTNSIDGKTMEALLKEMRETKQIATVNKKDIVG